MALSILIAAFAPAAILCASLIPLFRRLFLVVPGARSSHVQATPQGGGLVVVPVAILVAFGALAGAQGVTPDRFGWSLAAGLALLAALGARDDLRPLGAAFRLLVQGAAAALALAATPRDFAALLWFVPAPLVVAAALIGMLWLINLTNFMDGIDLMTVSQFVPAFATVYRLLAGLAGPPQWVGALCLAFAGALAGFALLNRPRARLFLGDFRQPAARAARRGRAAGRRGRPRPRARAAALPLLRRGRDADAAAPPRRGRAGLGGASRPFLPARQPRGPLGLAGDRAGDGLQCRALRARPAERRTAGGPAGRRARGGRGGGRAAARRTRPAAAAADGRDGRTVDRRTQGIEPWPPKSSSRRRSSPRISRGSARNSAAIEQAGGDWHPSRRDGRAFRAQHLVRAAGHREPAAAHARRPSTCI